MLSQSKFTDPGDWSFAFAVFRAGLLECAYAFAYRVVIRPGFHAPPWQTTKHQQRGMRFQAFQTCNLFASALARSASAHPGVNGDCSQLSQIAVALSAIHHRANVPWPSQSRVRVPRLEWAAHGKGSSFEIIIIIIINRTRITSRGLAWLLSIGANGGYRSTDAPI